MHGQLYPGLVELVGHPFLADWVVFIDVRKVPLLIGGEITQHT